MQNFTIYHFVSMQAYKSVGMPVQITLKENQMFLCNLYEV